MDHTFRKYTIGSLILVLFFLSGPIPSLKGQQIPSYPVSSKIYNHFILNPANAGSKDFFNLDMSLGKSANINSLFFAGSARIMKHHSDYPAIPSLGSFTNFGAGGYAFHEKNGLYSNAGIAGAFSYHMKLTEDALSFISAGISGKIIHTSYAGDPDLSRPSLKTTYSDIDLGLYYYSPSFYTGLSVLNIFSDFALTDTSAYNAANLSRHLNAVIGF